MSKTSFSLETDPPHGPHEPDFRRGFHHGAVAMLAAIRDDVPIEKLEDYIAEELRPWRENSASPAFPPYPKADTNTLEDHELAEFVVELNRGAAVMAQAVRRHIVLPFATKPFLLACLSLPHLKPVCFV